MLILTRRPHEAVRIGSDITVTVLSVQGHQVRLGIEAPLQVVVDRQEIYDRKQIERREAASGAVAVRGLTADAKPRPRPTPLSRGTAYTDPDHAFYQLVILSRRGYTHTISDPFASVDALMDDYDAQQFARTRFHLDAFTHIGAFTPIPLSARPKR